MAKDIIEPFKDDDLGRRDARWDSEHSGARHAGRRHHSQHDSDDDAPWVELKLRSERAERDAATDAEAIAAIDSIDTTFVAIDRAAEQAGKSSSQHGNQSDSQPANTMDARTGGQSNTYSTDQSNSQPNARPSGQHGTQPVGQPDGQPFGSADQPSEEPLSEADREFTREEPRKPSKFKEYAGSVLSGNILSNTEVRKLYPYLLFISFLILVYISNVFRTQQLHHQQEKLTIEVKELRAKSMTMAAMRMNATRQSQIITELQARGIELEESLTPPKVIKKK